MITEFLRWKTFQRVYLNFLKLIRTLQVGQCVIASRIDLMKIWNAELAWFQEKIAPNAEFEEQVLYAQLY